MRILLRLMGVLLLAAASARAEPAYADRWVWIFGWGLGQDSDVAEICAVLEQGAKHGINGACLSCGLDKLEGRPAAYFDRLDRIRKRAEELGLELIPAAYSIGYGGGFLGHNKHLAEGLPVTGSLYVARGDAAAFVPGEAPLLQNGDFETFRANKFSGFGFHDAPGVISFADTNVFHGGRAAIRLENFTSAPSGNGRAMQEVKVRPRHAYRFDLWVKTENLTPTTVFNMQVLAGDRALAPRTFGLKATEDWRRLSMLFNSATNESVRLYAGMWGGRGGKLWLDDWRLVESGPINVLRRPGTPVQVQSDDGAQSYEEGRDFAPLEDSAFSLWRGEDHAPVPLRLLPGSRIRDGDRLRVSWYHPMLIHDSQVTVCMAEPEIYEILERETKLLGRHLHPKRVLLNFDEVRMGGTCAACRGRDMAQLLGECTTRAAATLKRNIPGVQVLAWSDMFDPHHNARGNYYLVEGDFTGSWTHLPKDIGMAVWGGGVRAESLSFFEEQGFPVWAACYYDADSLDTVRGWIEAARPHGNIKGFMYTPWSKKYALLGEFGDLLQP